MQIHNTPPGGARTSEPVLWSTREDVDDVPTVASNEHDKATVLTACKVVSDLSMTLSE